MRLTKSKLKQIIKEELNEVSWENVNPLKEVYDALRTLADGLDNLEERIKFLERYLIKEVY